MSRSCWALAESRCRGVFVHGAGERRRFEGRLRLGPELPPRALSATKYAAVLVAAAMLVMAVEPARALASSGRTAHSAPRANQAEPAVLAPGTGYRGGKEAALVRSLQRRLAGQGYSPGPVDGRYGSRTENAVELFQSARGLRVDGIAGPLTIAALRTSVLYPGAGYSGAGSGQVRGLQRQLRSEGYNPGPIDGRYGPKTEGAVRRFQAAHGLRVDGIVGQHTFGELKRIVGGQPTATRSRPPLGRTHSTRPRGRATHVPAPPRSRAPRGATPRSGGTQHGSPTSRPGGASSPLALVVVGVVALAALTIGGWLIARRRRSVTVAPAADAVSAPAAATRQVQAQPEPAASALAARAAPQEADRVPAGLDQYENLAAAELSFRDADERGDAAAASNLGVVLEHRGDLAGAEAAYRRADARGSAEGAFNLAGLLVERREVEEALAAYRRADVRGDAGAASALGRLLHERGDVPWAEEAFRRADARGDSAGAFNLGAILESRGDLDAAAAAYDRADRRGDQEAAARLGMLLERQHDYRAALQAYGRARRSDRPEIAELARFRAEALELGLSLAGKRGES